MLHFNSCSRSNLKSITIISGKRQTQNVPSGNQRWPEQVITQIYSGLWIPVATINMAYLFPSYDKSLTSDNYILKVVHEDIYTQHITTALTVWMVHVIYYTVDKNTRTQTKHSNWACQNWAGCLWNKTIFFCCQDWVFLKLECRWYEGSSKMHRDFLLILCTQKAPNCALLMSLLATVTTLPTLLL